MLLRVKDLILTKNITLAYKKSYKEKEGKMLEYLSYHNFTKSKNINRRVNVKVKRESWKTNSSRYDW
jgi:hypothetical protein